MGSKSTIAYIAVTAVVVGLFFYGIARSTTSRVYESTGTVSSTTYTPGGFTYFECTRIRFIATDFSILAYGNYSSLEVGHEYTFTYTHDLNDIVTITSYREIK